jgi:endoglucanase
MRHLLCLIALITPFTLSAAPKFPFPQKAKYEYGIMPANIDHDKVQAAFDDFMKLYEEQGDLARIKHDNPENTVSEGIAYGMLIMVYMDNEENNTQGKFDKLWNYYNKYPDQNGLMNWKINGFSDAANFGAATDAEIDAAVALLQAYKQWDNEKYLNDARSLIDKMAQHEVNDNGFLKPGDTWDNKKNPSYFSTAALEMFKEVDDFDWANVLAKSYELLKKSQNSSTGLIPDWCSEDGNAVDGDKFYYDAARAPWRIAWAHSWFGHQDAKDICTKMASWITTKTGGDPSKVTTGYQLDGTALDEWHNATFVGPFVCTGMVDASHQDWVDDGFSYLVDMPEDVYFQVSMKMLTTLYLSGNMPNLWTHTSVEYFTLATSVTPEQGGTITVSPEESEYADGTEVTLTAEPAEGYAFVSWGEDATGNTANTQITISGNMNVSATFELETPVNRFDVSNGTIIPGVAVSYTNGTMVSYSVGTPGNVSIAVYSPSGKKIAMPLNTAHTSRGVHTFFLSKYIPAGVYPVRMTSPDGEFVERISIAR